MGEGRLPSYPVLLCPKCGPGTPTKPVAHAIPPVIPSCAAPVASVQVARHGHWETVEFMITPLPTIPCVELPQTLLDTSVPTHKALLSRHPGLRTDPSPATSNMVPSLVSQCGGARGGRKKSGEPPPNQSFLEEVKQITAPFTQSLDMGKIGSSWCQTCDPRLNLLVHRPLKHTETALAR